MDPPKQIKLTFAVRNPAQAQELETAWREIITERKLARMATLDHDVEAIMERARTALEILETTIREHPTTSQAGRLVRFLAGVYNGCDYPFDLTDLRALDTRLANACLDYLNYDRLAKCEVHHHLVGGDVELHRWIQRYRIAPSLHLNEEQAYALAQLETQTDRYRDELLREAVDDFLDKYRRKTAAAKS